MMKEVIRTLETGILSEIGLLAFFLAFMLILIRVAVMTKAERDQAKHLPLHDDEWISTNGEP